MLQCEVRELSIIVGYIDLNKKKVIEDIASSMTKISKEYKIDKFDSITRESLFLGCGLQYFTKEAIHEILPYHDKDSELLLTSDAIIDNREELIEILELDKKQLITDSFIILESYKKWGKACLDYLIGDFTFAIYDEKNQEIFIARDQIGKRCLYYHIVTGLTLRGKSLLVGGFALRCFQRLSRPYVATQLCPWQNNWCTRGMSIPVLSY